MNDLLSQMNQNLHQKSMAARKKRTAMPHQRIIREAQAII
jgi:hypothetical protein